MIKILIHKLQMNVKDCLLVLFLGIGGGLLFPYIGILFSPIMVASLCYHTYKVSKYSFEKSIFLSTFVMLIGILLDHVASIIISLIFNETAFVNEHLLFFHLPISAILAILFTFFFTKLTEKMRVKINQNKQLQMVLAIMTTLILFTFYGGVILGTYLGSGIELITLNFIFLAVYLFSGLIIFYFYSKTLREKYEMQRHKDEQENLQRYTKEIETQYTEMRKFKHDYQNILSSLDSFVVEEDFQGLKSYYLEKIKVTSDIMNEHLFQLEALSKIEVREIKSILAMKLMRAQEQGIYVIFEAVDTITSIPLDSVVLVRALGILLDNAIEELTEVNDGTLLVGVIKNEQSTIFIVQNTCRNSTPKVHKLKQLGFSSKGDGRGVGLNNLSEFVKMHSNMLVETTIDGSQFIQKITIGG